MQMDIHSPGSLLASFVFINEIKPGLTLVTGSRGSGKTNWCMALVRRAYAFGLCLGGLVSPPVLENGKRIRIDLLAPCTGERRPLAYRRGNKGGDISTAAWQLAADTLEWGNSVLERFEPCDLFILDEMSPLEFDHNVGFVAAFDIVARHKDIPSFITIRPSLLPIARLYWPWGQILDLSPTTVDTQA